MATYDQDMIKRATRLRQMMNEFLRKMTPQERDRKMQIHLAQARGSVANALGLRQMTNFMMQMKQAQMKGPSDD